MMDKFQNSIIKLLLDFLVKHGLYILRDKNTKFCQIFKHTERDGCSQID